MNGNLLLAMIYKQYGYSYGVIETLGDGPPSQAALTLVGFPWPVGTVLSKSGHKYRVDPTAIFQLDTD